MAGQPLVLYLQIQYNDIYIIFISTLLGVVYSKGNAILEYFEENSEYALSSFYVPYNIFSDIILFIATIYFNYYYLALILIIFYIIHSIYYIRFKKSTGEINE